MWNFRKQLVRFWWKFLPKMENNELPLAVLGGGGVDVEGCLLAHSLINGTGNRAT